MWKPSRRSQAKDCLLLEDNRFYCLLLLSVAEITQDLAGKGLGLVYDISGKEQKDELVSILVQTLTGAR